MPRHSVVGILIFGFGIFLLACGSPAPTLPPTASPAPTGTPAPRAYPLPPRLASPEYGIQTFLWWHIGDKDGQRDAQLVKDLGFGWLKQEFLWSEISNTRGFYHWEKADQIVATTERLGLKLIVRLGHPPAWAQTDPRYPVALADFEDHCAQVAARYAGRIAAYEVWNEPNLRREWAERDPDPAAYTELLKTCYLALKQADPQAIVISAGLAPTICDLACGSMPDQQFFNAMYAAGAAPYFDMLGVHAPGYSNPPELAPADVAATPTWGDRVYTFRYVEDIRALMLQQNDGDKQMAITEFGWTLDQVNPTYAWYAVTEQQQADYLVRAYQYAKANWSPWMGLMSAIYIADPDWNDQAEQYWWAITRPTRPGDPAAVLPAYEALQKMSK